MFKDNVAMPRTMKDMLKVRRDRLVNNFHSIEDILTHWRVSVE
jgi:hypothetical protein